MSENRKSAKSLDYSLSPEEDINTEMEKLERELPNEFLND